MPWEVLNKPFIMEDPGHLPAQETVLHKASAQTAKEDNRETDEANGEKEEKVKAGETGNSTPTATVEPKAAPCMADPQRLRCRNKTRRF